MYFDRQTFKAKSPFCKSILDDPCNFIIYLVLFFPIKHLLKQITASIFIETKTNFNMEQQNQNPDAGLFGLSIDTTGREHLTEAARWARFLAIVGFVLIALVAIFLIAGGSYIANMFDRVNQYNEVGAAFTTGMTIGIIIYYWCVALLVFFAYLFLYRFAINMKMALRGNNQELLNRSFQNLKILYRYWGILTIIGLIFFGLAFVIGILGRA